MNPPLFSPEVLDQFPPWMSWLGMAIEELQGLTPELPSVMNNLNPSRVLGHNRTCIGEDIHWHALALESELCPPFKARQGCRVVDHEQSLCCSETAPLNRYINIIYSRDLKPMK